METNYPVLIYVQIGLVSVEVSRLDPPGARCPLSPKKSCRSSLRLKRRRWMKKLSQKYRKLRKALIKVIGFVIETLLILPKIKLNHPKEWRKSMKYLTTQAA